MIEAIIKTKSGSFYTVIAQGASVRITTLMASTQLNSIVLVIAKKGEGFDLWEAMKKSKVALGEPNLLDYLHIGTRVFYGDFQHFTSEIVAIYLKTEG